MRRFLLLLAFVSIGFFTSNVAFSQSQIVKAVGDTTGKLRQYSIGLNALQLLPGYDTYEPSLVGYMQHRNGRHGFRVSFSALNGALRSHGLTDRPEVIYATDSSLTVGEKLNRTVSAGGGLEYLHFMDNGGKNFELYFGVGLYGGSVNDEHGYVYSHYRKDTLGVLQLDEQAGGTFEVNQTESYRGFQAGAVPVAGIQALPKGPVSLALEIRLPLLYERRTAYDGWNTQSGFGMNTQIALNATVHLFSR